MFAIPCLSHPANRVGLLVPVMYCRYSWRRLRTCSVVLILGTTNPARRSRLETGDLNKFLLQPRRSFRRSGLARQNRMHCTDISVIHVFVSLSSNCRGSTYDATPLWALRNASRVDL